MKTLTACAFVLAGCVSLAAQDVVDSIVYDEGMEWKVFSTDGPALRFAVQKGTLWMATADKVVTVNTKTNAIKNFSTLGPMPASGVRAMAVDSRGRVWIGTSDGLAMTAGAGFKVFTEENGLCNNAINVIHGMADGSVWVGTDNGMCVWNSGAWKTFTKENGLRGNRVKAIEEGQGGALWIGTNFGISIYDKGAWSSQSMDDGMSWNDVKALGYDERKNRMWAAVGDEDVNCFDGKAWKIYMGVEQGISCIMVDTQSRLWLGTGAGLMKFNGEPTRSGWAFRHGWSPR